MSVSFSAERRVHGPDVLRGIAACSVVAFHVLYLSGQRYGELPHVVVGRFDFFVRLFFAVSAFSIAYAWRHRLVSLLDVRRFYVKRFFRIAPLFYFVMALGLIYGKAIHDHQPDLYAWLLSLMFIFQFAPGVHGSLVGGGWSIGVEWMFYVSFPLMIAILTRPWHCLIVAIIFSLVAVIGQGFYSSYLNGALREFSLLFFLSHVQYFVVGIAVLLISERNRVLPLSQGLRGVVVVAALFAVIVYFNLSRVVPEEIALTVLIFVMLYYSVLGLPVWLDNVSTRWLGRISYSVYLVQFPVIQALNESGVYSFISGGAGDGGVAFMASSILTIVLVVGVSALTYNYVELPGQALGRYFTSSIRSSTVWDDLKLAVQLPCMKRMARANDKPRGRGNGGD